MKIGTMRVRRSVVEREKEALSVNGILGSILRGGGGDNRPIDPKNQRREFCTNLLEVCDSLQPQY
jgi:hypothetical protein